MKRFIIYNRRVLLSLSYCMVLSISFNVRAQSVKRQCISSYGSTALTGSNTFMQTIGQPYSTTASYVSTVSVTQGFQQPVIFKVQPISNRLKKSLNVSVYPNPAIYSVTISSGELIENAIVRVMDANGKLILNSNVPQLQTHKVECSMWTNGNYIITVSDKNQNKSTLKLTINK
jgi:hypothetical protein